MHKVFLGKILKEPIWHFQVVIGLRAELCSVTYLFHKGLKDFISFSKMAIIPYMGTKFMALDGAYAPPLPCGNLLRDGKNGSRFCWTPIISLSLFFFVCQVLPFHLQVPMFRFSP